MKKPLISKHHYGFCIQLTHNIFFDIDYNEWHFIPSIEFHRRPRVTCMIIFAFLCFQLTIYTWRFF